MVDHFGDAVQHWSERSREKAYNGSSRQELFLALREDIGVRKVFSRTKSPRVLFAELCLNIGDGLFNEVVRTFFQLLENQGIGEGF